MKKAIGFLLSVTLVMWLSSAVHAIPIDFEIASNSSVTISNVSSWEFGGSSSVSAVLAGDLDSVLFTLYDGAIYTFDFFDITIEAEGFLSGGTADIEAILAFATPSVLQVTGTGSGGWLTFNGALSGGSLTWSNMPQTISLANGDYFNVDFEDIFDFGVGNSTTVSATITAHAGSSIPAPEPSTMLLISTGLLGLVACGRKRYKRKNTSQA